MQMIVYRIEKQKYMFSPRKCKCKQTDMHLTDIHVCEKFYSCRSFTRSETLQSTLVFMYFMYLYITSLATDTRILLYLFSFFLSFLIAAC